MLKKSLFRKPKNELESGGRLDGTALASAAAGEICVSCPACKKMLLSAELRENFDVCPKCGRHFRIGARRRIELTADEGSFEELYAQMQAADPIAFPGYGQKLESAAKESAEKEAVVCGRGDIGRFECAFFFMEPFFMMGSMGAVVGEKITRLFEYAAEKSLPVIGFSVSGGARMQEGIISLMQMAKTAAAVKRHSDAGNLYISVLTDPTMGGVSASFSMGGDITLAEPGALIGFAGPRVIEQTTRQRLPDGFQRAEFLLEKGFLDAICSRREMKAFLIKILSLTPGVKQYGSD